MSCSLIEAKFQVLDRTIKMLSKSKSLRTPKVASSEQLRELVDSQKPTSLLPSLKPVKGVVMTRSNQNHSLADTEVLSHLHTSREGNSTYKQELSPPRPSTGRDLQDSSSALLLPEKWIDPKQQRAEQLLQDTWHEIESAVNWGATTGSSSHERQMKVSFQICRAYAIQSRLLDKSSQDERLEFDLTSNETEPHDVRDSKQIYEDIDAFSAAVHNALPPPKRPLTTASLQAKRSKSYLSTRCRSASNNNTDHQPKNWFIPSTVSESTRRSPTKRKHCRQRQIALSNKQVKKQQHRQQQHNCHKGVVTLIPEKNKHPDSSELQATSNSAKKPSFPLQKSDDPSFYMLEVRLVHPDPLTEWRFQASFTDTSVSPAKTVILDDLMVDRDNCLIFEAPQPVQSTASSQYFNPFLYFPGLSRPSDLYGHVIRIIVTSLQPVTRIVINTSVQFTRFPDESVVQPPPNASRKHSEALATQEASLLRVLTRRNSSATLKKTTTNTKPKLKTKLKTKKTLTLVGNNHTDSINSLAMDQCSPWTSEKDELATDTSSCELIQTLTLNSLQLEETRSPSPTASGPTTDHLGRSPRLTIEKKKLQLQRLRANIRREMREEKSSNCNM